MTTAIHVACPDRSLPAVADPTTINTRLAGENHSLESRLPASSPVLRVDPIATDVGLSEIAGDWNGLAGSNPFRRWEWLEAWWRHFRRVSDELFVLTIRDAEHRLIGLAPWYVTRSSLSGRVVRFLGSGRVCSDYLGILCVQGRELDVARALAAWLVSSAAGSFQAIELTGVRADDESVLQLCQALLERNHQVHRTHGVSCWRVQLPDSWDSYLMSLSKSRRERVRQLGRRQLDTGRAVLKIAESVEDLNRGWFILLDLHQRRQQSLRRPGCFACPRFRGFLREAAERFLQMGRLRLQWVELDGQPIAVEFDLDAGEEVFFFQSGMAPEMAAERPGWLGTIAALRRAQQEGYRSFDFLRGDESYKSHWRAEPIPLVDLRIVGPKPIARLQHRLWSIKNVCKRWIKSATGSRRRTL